MDAYSSPGKGLAGTRLPAARANPISTPLLASLVLLPLLVSLFRAEGDVLARSAGPPLAPGQRQDGLVRAAISEGAERSVYEAGREAGEVPGLVAVRRIDGWPAYATALPPARRRGGRVPQVLVYEAEIPAARALTDDIAPASP